MKVHQDIFVIFRPTGKADANPRMCVLEWAEAAYEYRLFPSHGLFDRQIEGNIHPTQLDVNGDMR